MAKQHGVNPREAEELCRRNKPERTKEEAKAKVRHAKDFACLISALRSAHREPDGQETHLHAAGGSQSQPMDRRPGIEHGASVKSRALTEACTRKT